MTKIEIDLRDLGLPTYQDSDGEPAGAKNLQDLIIEAAADRLLGDTRDIKHELHDKFRKQYNERINEKVEAMIQEAFSAPIQRTTKWGETRGEVTTVKEIIREQIEAYMNGAIPSRNGYSTDAVSLTQLVQNEVKTIMTTDLKKTIDAAKANVHNEVTKAALQAAVEVLAK